MNPLAWADEALIAAIAAAVPVVIGWARAPIQWPRRFDGDDGAPTYQTPPPPPPPDRVPLEILLWLADPAEVAKAGRDRHKIDLQRDLRRRGASQPVQVTIDQHGHAAFTDGHHRLVEASEAGLPALTITINHVGRLPRWGRPVRPLLEHLLTGRPIG